MLSGKRLSLIVLAAAVVLAAVIGAARREETKGEAVVTIVGDIMLSRGVQQYLTEYGYDYPYEEIRHIFLEDDLTVGNLECPITRRESAADKTKRFVFRADEENAAASKRAGVDCLNLANNHSMDYLSGGLSDTMEQLKAQGLSFVGAGDNASADPYAVFEVNGLTIGLFAYSALPPEGFFFHKEKPTISYIGTTNLSRLETEIKAADCDFNIVYFHWGIEYEPYKSETQERLAKGAIDAGADLVVGAHPHVLQGKELYQGKYIYYSLGNFIFDRQIPPGTDESLILQLTIDQDGLKKAEEIPVKIWKGQPATTQQDR